MVMSRIYYFSVARFFLNQEQILYKLLTRKTTQNSLSHKGRVAFLADEEFKLG